MIYCQCNFISRALKSHVDVDVLLPSLSGTQTLQSDYDQVYGVDKKHPVLFLLHGALDDHSCWVRKSNVERYAQERGMAVVMPSGQNGFYTDALYGLRYFEFITEELPRFVRQNFPITRQREETFIAGLSMGGYGAAKCALTRPELYGGFAVLSGAVDPPTLEPVMLEAGMDFFQYDLIFGGTDKIPGTKDDLYQLARDRADDSDKPRAFIACGLSDTANYGANIRLREALAASGYEVHYEEGPGGHDWDFWDMSIGHVMKWL